MPSAFAFQKKAPPVDPSGAPAGPMDGPPPPDAGPGGPPGAEAPIMVTCPKCGDSFDVVQALTHQSHDAPSGGPSGPPSPDGGAPSA